MDGGVVNLGVVKSVRRRHEPHGGHVRFRDAHRPRFRQTCLNNN